VRKPLPQYATRGFLEGSKQITVKEISVGDAVRTTNPLQSFSMVLAPGSEYLQWRYASDLGYVRYRTFQIFKAGEPSGFCILNDAPKVIIVSYAEGPDPEILAKGIVKSIFALGEGKSRQHSAMLSSSDPRMQAVFGQAGFLPTALDRAYALGSLRGKLDSLGDSSSDWLINFGIGDNDLRQRYFWNNDAT